MTDFVHFDGFRAPLSSALFYIRLVIRYFSKTTEDRASSAKIGPPQMNAFETPACLWPTLQHPHAVRITHEAPRERLRH